MALAADKLGPLEVWLAWTKSQMTIRVRYVHDDESTAEAEAESVAMRGAQREITGQLIEKGWQPVGRWVSELDDADGTTLQCFRQFRPGKDAQAI
jgi:hypothetical protein